MDKKEFNRKCVECVNWKYGALSILELDNDGNFSYMPRDKGILPYNPHDDLNQMAEVVDKMLPEANKNDVLSASRLAVNILGNGIKPAMRDFITQTLGN